MYKTLFKNSSYLYLLHVIHIFLPLLVFPYLVRVLGVENFGIVAFSLAFMGYSSLVVNYGFDLGSSRDISINRKDRRELNKIFSATLYLKLIFLFACFLLMIVVAKHVDSLNNYLDILLMAYGVVVGAALMPQWLFQGLERLAVPALVGVMTKFLYLVLVFIFVKTTSDYDNVVIITSLTAILNGILGLYFAHQLLEVKFVRVPRLFLMKTLKDSWYLFISKVSISVYSISTVFILGVFSTESQVGIYAAAEKIIRAIQGLLNPVSQAFYPQMASDLSSPSRLLGLNKLRNVGLVMISAFFVISLGVSVFSTEIVEIILGSGFEQSAAVVRALAFIPFIVAISNFAGVQYMLNSNMKSVYVTILVIASILSILLLLIAVPTYGYIGASYVLLFIETFVAICMVAYVMFGYFKRKSF